MKLKEMNMLKRFFKRKLRITDAVLVSMIICGGASYSLDEIANDVGNVIKVTNNLHLIGEEKIYEQQKANALEVNSNSSNTIVTNEGHYQAESTIIRPNIKLNTTLNSIQPSLDIGDSSNGIFGDNITLKNTGMATGTILLDSGILKVNNPSINIVSSTSADWSANGVSGAKEVLNTGIISGKATLFGTGILSQYNIKNLSTAPHTQGSANGISNLNPSIQTQKSLTVNNDGVIRGNINITGGAMNRDVSSIIDSTYSGNGISSGNVYGLDTSPNNINDVTITSNSGIIKGEGTLLGSSVDIPVSSLPSLTTVSVYSKSNGNGIISGNYSESTYSLSDGELTISENSGVISGDIFIKSGDLINMSGVVATNLQDHFGYSMLISNFNGNGICTTNLKLDTNKGTISGKTFLKGGEIIISADEYLVLAPTVNSKGSGNGLYGNGTVKLAKNTGIISGEILAESGTTTKSSITKKEYLSLESSGNGIYGGNNINNDGIISGYASADNNNYLSDSGNGIVLSKNTNNIVDNKGVIKGNKSSITTPTDGIVNNYGVLAGDRIFSGNITEDNHGIYIDLKNDINNDIALDSNGNVEIEKINVSTSGTIIDGKEVINATDSNDHSGKDDVYFKVENTGNYNNLIVNGVGLESGTLTVEKDVDLNLKNSIVNSYKTAVTLNEGANFSATDTIFNGGGLQNQDSIIETKGDNVKIELKGTSTINGETTINGNDSTMSVSNQTQVNGNIVSNGTGNHLGLGDEDTSGSNLLIMYNDIVGFDKIDTKGSVMLSTEATIDKGTITVKEGSKLIVDLDGTSRDSNDYVTGHALYNHNGEIVLESPEKYTGPTTDLDDKSQIIFRASGLGENTVIAMNGTDVSSINDYYLGTYSIAHTARKLNDSDGNVIISVKNFDDIFPDVKPGPVPPTPDVEPAPDLKPDVKPAPAPDLKPDPQPDPIINNSGDIIEHRDDVKKVYEEIKNSGQIGILSPTTDTTDKRTDAKSELMSILDQIYANNPYAFVGEASKEAIDLFLGSHQYVAIPEKGDYLVYGTAISSYSNYHDVEMNNVIDGKDSINKYGRDTTTVGGLGDIEYGLGNKASLGFLFGGANQKVDMSHNSELDGDILYLGLYHRKELGKYTFETGAGYQYASYDVTRDISNKYQTIKNEGDVESNSVVLYEDIRYLLKDENGWKIQPKLTFTLVHVEQESTHEKKSDLSMNIDDQSYDYFDTEIGVEVTKEIMLEKGKLRTKGYLGYINSQGSSEEKVSAAFSQGGEKVNLLGPELNNNSGKVGIELTYEKLTGLEYSIGIDYKVGEKENNSTFGRIGIGYTF